MAPILSASEMRPEKSPLTAASTTAVTSRMAESSVETSCHSVIMPMRLPDASWILLTLRSMVIEPMRMRVSSTWRSRHWSLRWNWSSVAPTICSPEKFGNCWRNSFACFVKKAIIAGLQ